MDNSRKMYITHSGGTASTVSIVDLESGGFGAVQTVDVGTNPFGLAFVFLAGC